MFPAASFVIDLMDGRNRWGSGQVLIEGERTSQKISLRAILAKQTVASEIQEREAQKKAFHPEE